jgi:hypothetical protein
MTERSEPISGRPGLKPGDNPFGGNGRIYPADRCDFGQLGAMIWKMLADRGSLPGTCWPHWHIRWPRWSQAVAIVWRSATWTSSATSPTSATWCVPTGYWRREERPARSTTWAAARAPRSPMRSSSFGRWRMGPSRSESTRGGFAPSAPTSPSWSPTPPSFATPSAGCQASPSSRPWPTCLSSAARRCCGLEWPA